MTTFSRDLQEGLEGEYRVRLAWRYETVEFLGLPYLKDERPLTLQEIYVPLSLMSEYGGKDRVYLPEALEKDRHLVVLGDPGSGKSTLVKLLTYSFARIEPTPLARRLGSHLPVPIILRDYKVREWNSPEDMLRDFVARLDDEIREEVSVEWLIAGLREGRGILLLDGLDEVGSREDREHLRDKVVFPLLEKSLASYAVLTSRVVGYEEVSFEHGMRLVPFPELTDLHPTETESLFGESRYSDVIVRGLNIGRFYVAPFNDEEIVQFINKWYAAREREQDEQKRRVTSLARALQRNDSIKQLATNPSLLTLMVLIHRVTAELPSGRAKLYDKIVEAYLESIQRYRGLGTYEASLDQMKRWLARVGWEMQQRRSRTKERDLLARREEVLDWLAQAIETDRSDARKEASEFLDYVARRSGLLVPRGPEEFSFVHLTFQEYFAAWRLRGRLRRFEELVGECAKRATERDWHETLVLLFELLAEFPGTGDDLVQELTKYASQKPEWRQAVAELFAELVLDDQSGVGSNQRKEMAEFAMAAACTEYNQSVIDRLTQLTPEQTKMLVAPWIDQRMSQGSPQDVGEDFFVAAAQLDGLENWPKKLGRWAVKRGHLNWSRWQIELCVLTGGSDAEVSAWAAGRLPLATWFVRQVDLKPESIAGMVSLADFYGPMLLLIQDRSARHKFLAQLCAGHRVSLTQILPYVCLMLTSHDEVKKGMIFSRVAVLELPRGFETRVAAVSSALAQARVQDRLLAAALNIALAFDFTRGMLRDWILSSEIDLALLLARTLADSAGKSWPSALPPNEPLATRVMRTEWLFGFPDCAVAEFEAQVRELERLASASEDWVRLLGLTSLMLLGEGTPQRCAKRNELLDKGMNKPKSFTFPTDVQEAIDASEIRIGFPDFIRHSFLHEPGDPWLRPEWFDPAHPAARFFRAHPREFFTEAAEVLDPKGETGLAKWRKP